MKYFNLSLQTTLIEHLEGGLKHVIKKLNLKKRILKLNIFLNNYKVH